ncbi:MAG: response regulator [Acidobacteria bacterium]|nr:response regulator [Acidobacteriota bacterium]MBI3486640.1 response regulator [Acidobacteriota bacterium]
MLHDLRVHQIELELQNEELCRVQEDLDHSRARYFDLYDHAPSGYFTLDGQSLIQEANSTGAQLLGMPRSALAQLPMSMFILPADQDLFYFAQKNLQATHATQSLDLRMLKPHGSAFWVHMEATAGSDAGVESDIRLMLSDIDDRKRMEAVLHQSHEMESLGIMAGGVAHDMSNVLGVILALASVHEELEPAGSRAHKSFVTIAKACERGGLLVRSLLGFSRQGLIEEKEVDLNDLIRNDVGIVLRNTLNQINLDLDLAENLRPVLGDGSSLAHALMNLCGNAADAMREGGTLTIRSRNGRTDWVELLVEDTGTGMTEDILEKALVPFFTTKEHGKGTGMGLSIAHHTVQTHHGDLEILSQPGQGTRVLMRFPACERRAPVTDSPSPPLEESSCLSLRVLVVDDDELILHSMRELLEALGHSVAEAPSGEEALARLATGEELDVVFLDMNMPGLGGKGTLPRLRDLRPNLPVVITTGRPDQTVLDLMRNHPGVTLVSKPFSLQQIRDHLESLRHERIVLPSPAPNRRTSTRTQPRPETQLQRG